MKKGKLYKTDFLLPTVSFLTGVGSVFNLMGNFYTFKTSRSGLEADCRALESDWGVVGQDIEDAIQKLQQANYEQA